MLGILLETVVKSFHLFTSIFQTVFNVNPAEGTTGFMPHQSISKYYKVWDALCSTFFPRWHLMFVLSVSKTQKDVDSIANDDADYREHRQVLPETKIPKKQKNPQTTKNHQRNCG